MRGSNKIVTLAGLAAATMFLTGCPPTYPKCNSDENCKDHNEVCVQGQCQECATNENCKPGFICDGNKCVPKPECTSDGECAKGKKCQFGKCVVAEAGRPEGTCATNDDCRGNEECKNGLCVAKSDASCSFEPIRFAFNEHVLTPEAQTQLAGIAECLKKQKTKTILQGHADERGTEEYNMQLSNRRAASVKRYLVDLGVPASDLETIGYGENRPAVQGSNEAAWAANRRVEFSRR